MAFEFRALGSESLYDFMLNTVVVWFLRFEVWFGARRVHINLLGHLHVQECAAGSVPSCLEAAGSLALIAERVFTGFWSTIL